jgi:hypothetical protein
MNSHDIMTEVQISGAVNRYAERVHRLAGEKHHVASPLGAWLLIALCSSLAVGPRREEFTDVLGVEPEQAANFAALLLGVPHPLVSSGAAIWNRPYVDTERLAAWRASLAGVMETGDIPEQPALDQWANDHTMGLIKRFPLEVTRDVVLLMATALATRVSWARPFKVVAASELGPSSPWSSTLSQVLRSPFGPEHPQFITETDEAGLLAVHTAKASGGLLVTSVIAAPEVPAAKVLAAAHRLGTTEAIKAGSVERTSLFDLPLGEDRFWTITAEDVSTHSQDGREQRFRSIVPAWSAQTTLDLRDPGLGFAAAASAIGEVLETPGLRYEAKQSALARYSRVGFEAAAVTATMGMALSRGRRGIRRVAELRFGHPYAVVAVTVDEERGRRPWHGLPVFSAWIADPEDARE